MTHRPRDRRPDTDSPDNTVDGQSVLNDLPRFELDYVVDDQLEPSEVTLFAPDFGDDVTAWISASVDDAVDLAAVA